MDHVDSDENQPGDPGDIAELIDSYYLAVVQAHLAHEAFTATMKTRAEKAARDLTATAHAAGWLPPDWHFAFQDSPPDS